MSSATKSDGGKNEILVQIGLLDYHKKTNDNNRRNGNIVLSDKDGDSGVVAIEALRRLIESRQVSVEDARAAVQQARDSSKDTSTADEIAATDENFSKSGDKKHEGDGMPKKVRKQEQHHIRHVAIEFAYEGSDFTGFAENLRRDNDNSIEKTLFAALEKACLLVASPKYNGNGMLVANEINRKGEEERSRPKNYVKARAASQYSRCGRTDRGVHAQGQVVALYLKSAFPLSARNVAQPSTGGGDADNNGTAAQPGDLLQEESLPKNSLDGLECLVPAKKNKKGGDTAALQRKTVKEYDYPRILNNILPPSIRILGWCPVSPEFSARFSCSKRTYKYFFPRRNLHLSAMAEGLQYMMGRHDFRNFCKMNCEQVIDFERVLYSGRIVSPQEEYVVTGDSPWPSIEQKDDAPSLATASPHDMCHVEIVGQAFLWHQVRCMMAVLLLVGRQLEPPTVVQRLLDVASNPAKPSYEMANEAGLVLHSCDFLNLNPGRTARNLWDATRVLEQRWEDHAVAAERASDALDGIGGVEARWTDVAAFVEQIARDRRRKEKKRVRKGVVEADDEEGERQTRRALDAVAPETATISWASSLQIVQDVLGVYPYLPGGSGRGKRGKQAESSVHVPLMERSKGTTYEEKVKSILGLSDANKRKHRYEENASKKRRTDEETDHILRQGGSSV